MNSMPTADEIGRKGRAFYESRIRQVVERGNKGKFLYINIETGEYEIDSDRMIASRRAMSRFPGVPLYGMRIGYPAVGSIGSRLRPIT